MTTKRHRFRSWSMATHLGMRAEFVNDQRSQTADPPKDRDLAKVFRTSSSMAAVRTAAPGPGTDTGAMDMDTGGTAAMAADFNPSL